MLYTIVKSKDVSCNPVSIQLIAGLWFMVKEYTITQLSEILKISKQATDKKIKKLEKDGLKSTIRSINNRPTKIVFLNDSELNNLINNTLSNQFDIQTNNHQEQPYKQPEQPTENQLHFLIAELSAKAGKYELLEDKQREYQDDKKYWQEKYFESETEVKTLIKLNTQLSIENQQLKEQTSKKWWKLGK